MLLLVMLALATVLIPLLLLGGGGGAAPEEGEAVEQRPKKQLSRVVQARLARLRLYKRSEA